MRLLALLLMLSITACGDRTASRDDVVGRFCAGSKLFGGDDRTYQLILSADGRYRYQAFDEAADYKLDRSGPYRIYGGPPVQRVELIGLCFSADNHVCRHKNIGYPAEVALEFGEVRIFVEDAAGTPLMLTKGSCERNVAVEPAA